MTTTKEQARETVRVFHCRVASGGRDIFLSCGFQAVCVRASGSRQGLRRAQHPVVPSVLLLDCEVTEHLYVNLPVSKRCHEYVRPECLRRMRSAAVIRSSSAIAFWRSKGDGPRRHVHVLNRRPRLHETGTSCEAIKAIPDRASNTPLCGGSNGGLVAIVKEQYYFNSIKSNQCGISSFISNDAAGSTARRRRQGDFDSCN